MYQKFAAVVMAVMVISCSYSQRLNSSRYISLSLGASIPVGDYGETQLSNQYAAFAAVGPQARIAYRQPVNKQVGIMLMAYGQKNRVDSKAMEKQFSITPMMDIKIFASAYPSQAPLPPPTYTVYPDWRFERSSWRSASVVAGPDIELPAQWNDKLFFAARVLAGAMFISSPGLKGSSSTDTSFAQIEQSKESATGFCYLVGAGLRYNINKKITGIVSIDYSATNKMSFKQVKTTFTSIKYPNGPIDQTQISQATFTGTGKQNLQVLSAAVGIAVTL